MPSEQVKSLMLAWLTDDAQSREQFSTWVATTQHKLEWGEITPQLEFQPLKDVEIMAQSLIALAEHSDSGLTIAHQNVAVWAESLGTDNELPRPQ